MRYLLGMALAVTLAAASQVGKTEDFGSATGVVLDSAGKPLSGATVYALPKEDMLHQIRTSTDSEGRFTLRGLPPGGEYLGAFKESDGYPYNFFSFFKSPGDRTPVEIKITAGKVSPNIVLQLGLRAAYIQLDITNDDGSPLGGALSFDRPDIPGPYRRGVSANELLMVPAVPFRLMFEAVGYLPWHYGGERWRGNSGFITLKPGETMHLQIHPKRSP
jgi:hypothetical protein